MFQIRKAESAFASRFLISPRVSRKKCETRSLSFSRRLREFETFRAFLFRVRKGGGRP